MPRVDNIGANVRAWGDATGEGSSTWDVCVFHARRLDANPHRFDDVLVPYGAGEPSGEDGRGDDVEHPPYDDLADGGYTCAICGTALDPDIDN